MAEDAAPELPNLPLSDALQLVKLCAERGSPKSEKAVARAVPDREAHEDVTSRPRTSTSSIRSGGTATSTTLS